MIVEVTEESEVFAKEFLQIWENESPECQRASTKYVLSEVMRLLRKKINNPEIFTENDQDHLYTCQYLFGEIAKKSNIYPVFTEE